MTTNIRTGLATALLTLALSAPTAAQVTRSTPGQAEARTALELMPAKARLTVTTPAFKDRGDIPFENTQYRTNTFPGLSWTAGPSGAKTYAIIMQDSSLLLRGAPILHWTMFNIPASVTSLPVGMAPDAKPPSSGYGPNYMGQAKPYTGPKTPAGVKDDYHFQVFALDVAVPEAAGGSYPALVEAMTGHVLASGEVVGVGQADPAAPPPPPPPPRAAAAPTKP